MTETPTQTLTETPTVTTTTTPTITMTPGVNPAPVNLGSAGTYAVLAGTQITSSGPTTLCGNLGLSPDTLGVSGTIVLTCGGVENLANAPAAQAQVDLTAAYTYAQTILGGVTTGPELGGVTLTGGIYNSATGFTISIASGNLTLDGQNNPNSVFIFQAGAALTANMSVILINGAQASNVYWQVTSSATINGAQFAGTIMALDSITFGTGVAFDGRALARNGEVTLLSQSGGLDTPTPTSATTSTHTPTPSPSQTMTATPTVSVTVTVTPTPGASGLGILALAPVPAHEGSPVILFFDKTPASTSWDIYNVAGAHVAKLSFTGFTGPESHYWDTAGVSPGLYFVRIQINYLDGTNLTITRKAVVIP
jgi:hypothetical protein